ncbi:hypothetical protein [Acinetobacter calcoaceticus]
MAKTENIEQGLNSIFGALFEHQSREAQDHPLFKLLTENPELFKSPSSFKFTVLYKLNNAIEEAVKKLKGVNEEYTDIFIDFQFYEDHIEKLCTRFEGSGCCADKSKVIVERYLNYLRTGDKGKWEAGEEVYIEKIKENISCYWLPKFGTQDDWFNLLNALWFFKYGNPERYLRAYKTLIEAGQTRVKSKNEQ